MQTTLLLSMLHNKFLCIKCREFNFVLYGLSSKRTGPLEFVLRSASVSQYRSINNNTASVSQYRSINNNTASVSQYRSINNNTASVSQYRSINNNAEIFFSWMELQHHYLLDNISGSVTLFTSVLFESCLNIQKGVERPPRDVHIFMVLSRSCLSLRTACGNWSI